MRTPARRTTASPGQRYETPSGNLLRVITSCETRDEFVARFGAYAKPDALLMELKRPLLAPRRVVVLLGDGVTPVIEGTAHTEDAEAADLPSCWLVFEQLDHASADMFEQLCATEFVDPPTRRLPTARVGTDAPEKPDRAQLRLVEPATPPPADTHGALDVEADDEPPTAGRPLAYFDESQGQFEVTIESSRTIRRDQVPLRAAPQTPEAPVVLARAPQDDRIRATGDEIEEEDTIVTREAPRITERAEQPSDCPSRPALRVLAARCRSVVRDHRGAVVATVSFALGMLFTVAVSTAAKHPIKQAHASAPALDRPRATAKSARPTAARDVARRETPSQVQPAQAPNAAGAISTAVDAARNTKVVETQLAVDADEPSELVEPAEPTEPAERTLRLTSSPKGATFLVNGRRVGRAPRELVVPATANLTITARRRGYLTRRMRVAKGRKDRAVHLRLRRRTLKSWFKGFGSSTAKRRKSTKRRSRR